MKQIKTLIVALTLIIGSQFTTAQTKVAHINVQELMTANPAMKAAEAQVKKLQETYDVEYKKMVQEYQTKLAQYEKESATVGDAVNQTRSQEMQDMGSRIQKFQDNASKALQDKAIELQKPIMEKAQAAIQKIARAKGIQYVLDSTVGGGVILADGPDLMADVKKELGY
ncbi:OmpH family outer membrane protein [Flavobacterium sp.]|jgi:outer membrane protein|uniref:OmpH family outer membrane protein n=1 Tax=Flavobacterium sp. TaxID=239 RepID=UPI0025B911C4|nr:OmpH family outer membrane protein [Flavobacterium sp.]|eukprot:comp24757_c0_seq1/m.60743 comp24757_c0_seq1/g.60743  ORF comp24757_c0_seq1/g.60743 comp24757_c0_seq1/m.60743 type:complete len:169 (-) comp24757_c0_seq1:24-530(-)